MNEEISEEISEIDEEDADLIEEDTDSIEESLYLDATTIDKGHTHTYVIDIDGDGETLKTINLDKDNDQHIHKIEKFKVKITNRHNHRLKPNINIQNKKIKSQSQSIREQKIILNTGNDGTVQFITKKIKGKLAGIIIESQSMVNVKISLEEFDDIILYEQQGFVGTKYLSLRNDVTFSNNERAQGDGALWILNDKIKIQVEGGVNSLIGFIVRYK